jgi:hypothetical protein
MLSSLEGLDLEAASTLHAVVVSVDTQITTEQARRRHHRGAPGPPPSCDDMHPEAVPAIDASEVAGWSDNNALRPRFLTARMVSANRLANRQPLREASMRIGFRLSAVVSVVALTLTGLVSAGAATAAAPPASVAAVVTASTPHTLYISVANRYLTMPRRIVAGRYYVQVRTSDPRSVVQVVRPPVGYTPRQFLDARTRWGAAYNSGAPSLAAYTAFVRSVTFVGGAVVARGGVSTFATGFGAGTYWLYEDTYDGPTHLARIVILTVVGTPPAQTPFAHVGLVRFSSTGAVTLPATLPRAGWLMGIGGAPLNSLRILKLLPGITQADLDTFGVCFLDGPPTSAFKDCFDTSLDLGGKVSAGASVFWYYRLAPGDYIAGNIAPNELFDRPLLKERFAAFKVL